MCDRTCDCAEEQARKERERAIRAAKLARAREEAQILAQEAELARLAGLDIESREPPPPRFSPVQIVLGSTGFLLGLLTLIFKTMDQDRAHAILSKVGLGNLIPQSDRARCEALKLSQRKRRPCKCGEHYI